MKMNNLLTVRIQEKMDTFSKGQKLIARYISEHYDKVAFMTASRLGATVGVSESTVVRFATEIGYTGYPELQQAMQEMIRNKLTSVQRMQVTEGRIKGNDILDSIFTQDMDIIRRTMEETSRHHIYAVCCGLLQIITFCFFRRKTIHIRTPFQTHKNYRLIVSSL